MYRRTALSVSLRFTAALDDFLPKKQHSKLKNFRKIQSLLHPWHKFAFVHIILMRAVCRHPETRSTLMLTENSFALSVLSSRFRVCSRGHPEDEGQQDGQQEGAGSHSSEVEEKTHSQHRHRLGNTPTQQQLPHCLTELRKEDITSSHTKSSIQKDKKKHLVFSFVRNSSFSFVRSYKTLQNQFF